MKIEIDLSIFEEICLGSTGPETIKHQVEVLTSMDVALFTAVREGQIESFTHWSAILEDIQVTLQYAIGNLRYAAKILDSLAALNDRHKPKSVQYRGVTE